jgi:predicted DsbA family dithiol-disulfide isomerase
VKVEIWSDVVCPWCYIGKRRFETALSRFEHADAVEVTWRSFQLDPSVAEGDVHPTLPALARKYGRTEEQMREQMTSMDALALREGLHYDLANGVAGNTLLAHQLLHLAAERGLQGELKERLLHAHFEQSTSVFDVDSLVQLGTEVGLDAEEARAALTDRRYLPAVEEDIATARARGAVLRRRPHLRRLRRPGPRRAAAAAGPRLGRQPPAGHCAPGRRLRGRQLQRVT